MPFSRSNMSQVAPRTSPRRAPVNIKSLMALAETGSVWSFSACAKAAISVRLRKRLRFSSAFLRTPAAGLSVQPLPADREVERPAKHLDDAVGPDRRAANIGYVAMKLVDVVGVDRRDLQLAEPRQDDFLPHAALVGLGADGLSGQVFGLVAFPEILQGRGYAISVAFAHRIVAAVDLRLSFLAAVRAA